MAKWFYLTDGLQHGPIEPVALKQLATSGRLKPTDKVRREDLPQWYQAKQVKGLFPLPDSKSAIASGRPLLHQSRKPQLIRNRQPSRRPFCQT